jgi:hypothetical protein
VLAQLARFELVGRQLEKDNRVLAANLVGAQDGISRKIRL